jgi:hypothetical protein
VSARQARTAGVVALVGALLLVAFVRGWTAVDGLQWPWDPDHFRNIAGAVTFKDGGVLSDPHYSGVPAWYSPLTSALLATGSLLTRVPVHRLGTQVGAVLNLLTPLALCWLAARWFGRRVAVLALVAYLFVIGAASYPPWAVATYTPWLFVNVYGIGVFVLALAAIPAALDRSTVKDALLLGGAAGVTFLVHPALAVLLAAVVSVQLLARCWHASRPVIGRLARTAGTSFAAALVVSAPFWLPIMVRYQWRVANNAPGDFTWSELDGGNVWGFLRDFVARWPMLVIAVGLPLWFLRRRRQRPADPTLDTRASIVATWTVVSFVGLLLAAYRNDAGIDHLPIPDTPAHHYLLAFSVALCIWFALALDTIIRVLVRRWAALAVVAVTVGITAVSVPGWRNRSEFVAGRSVATAIDAHFDHFAVVDWIRAHTSGNDIFLNDGAGPWNDVMLPGIAGRKSVAINLGNFSNPFVDFDARQEDAARMLRAVRLCQLERFERLARPYGRVRYVISETGASLAGSCRDRIPTVYRDSAVTIQRIDAPGRAPNA